MAFAFRKSRFSEIINFASDHTCEQITFIKLKLNSPVLTLIIPESGITYALSLDWVATNFHELDFLHLNDTSLSEDWMQLTKCTFPLVFSESCWVPQICRRWAGYDGLKPLSLFLGVCLGRYQLVNFEAFASLPHNLRTPLLRTASRLAQQLQSSSERVSALRVLRVTVILAIPSAIS